MVSRFVIVATIRRVTAEALLLPAAYSVRSAAHWLASSEGDVGGVGPRAVLLEPAGTIQTKTTSLSENSLRASFTAP